MTNSFEVIPNHILGIPQYDETFPIVFRFIEGDFAGWFVSLESLIGGKIEFCVLRVPQNITDKQIKKNHKKLSKILKQIINSAIQSDNDGLLQHSIEEPTI
jgi:Ni/Fe-hydrogenase subunit HybB-like protein